jgi:beta-1,2-mannosyltransferase
MQIPGFVNTGLPGKRSCDTLKYNSTVGVQKSFFLNDNIKQIAMSLDSHPIVDYPDDIMNDASLKVEDIVEQTWARLSGSSVWLPAHRVYLSVTRVIFCPTRTRSVPKMSFLRGQLFNEDWEHLENYNLTWGDKNFNFPLVFDVPAQWETEGSLYGPEDPRIILEEGVENPEPIIVFNMIARRSDWKRAMYILRPFSNYSTILTVRDTERQYTEKNWAPFFVPQEEVIPAGKLHLSTPAVVRTPNEYLHFIYSFKPLRILKCHLRCGDCEFVYEQSIPENFLSQHNEDGGSLRGGTNFVPVPIPAHMGVDPKVRVYASFPRTNIERRCDGSFYRPEFVVMINIGTQYHLAFASESLDFGNAILELGPEDDRCDKGRILIPNSIAQWDTSKGQDVMSVTFSVNDETVQVARVQGLLKFVWDLPQFKSLLKKDGLLKGDNSEIMNMLSSWVGDDVRGCLVEAALNYTQAAQEITHPREHKNADVDPSKELLHKIHEEEEVDDKAKDGEGEGDNDIVDPFPDDEDEGIPDLELELHPDDLDVDMQLSEPDWDEEVKEGDGERVEGFYGGGDGEKPEELNRKGEKNENYKDLETKKAKRPRHLHQHQQHHRRNLR